MVDTRPILGAMFDRIVETVAPTFALRRMQSRMALNEVRAYAANKHYEAASASPHRKFHRDGASPNQIVGGSAVALRAQARHLQRNHDIARGILRTMVNNIVGEKGIGIEPQPRRADGSIHEEYAAQLREVHRVWALKPEVTGRHTWTKVQRLMVASWIRDGEAFTQDLIGRVPGLVHSSALPYSLEMFEADLVPYDYQDGARIQQGVERNDWGRPLGYFVYKGYPGDTAGLTLGVADVKRVPAERVCHMALIDRIGQMRGISEFASVITRLEDIKDYEESERIAAKVAAALTAYVKRTSPDGYEANKQQIDPDTGLPKPRDMRMAPGMILDNLAVGEEIGIISSDRPNPNVITFRQGQLRAAAAGVGASYSSIARDYNGTYSAQRQELVEQYINYATLTDEVTGQLIQPTWSTLVTVADISGVAPIPPDVVRSTADDALYVAQAMPWINPLHEASAALSLVQAGFASEVEIMRKRGVNPRDLLQQTTNWRKQAKEAGLVFNSDVANTRPAAGSTPTA